MRLPLLRLFAVCAMFAWELAALPAQAQSPERGIGAVLFVSGGVVFAGSVVHDIFVGAAQSARKSNDELRTGRLHSAMRERSPAKAFLWSFGGTVIPTVLGGAVGSIVGASDSKMGSAADAMATSLMLSGMFLGPSAGHWYAGQTSRGVKTAGTRLVGATVCLIGLVMLISFSSPHDSH